MVTKPITKEVTKPTTKPTENKTIVTNASGKSKKFWIIGGIVLAVIIIGIIVAAVMVNSSGKRSFIGLTEEEKYIQFQVEAACAAYAMTAEIDEEDTEAGMEVIGKIILLMQEKAQEYGYSQEDFQSLSMKYDEDPSVRQKAEALISEKCPGVLANS